MPGGSGLPTQDQTQPNDDILAAIRNAIANWWELESVGGRDADSNFDINDVRDQDFVGNDVVYTDNDGSFWFDQNGNGTVETQFWIRPDGTVWYDLNNDGYGDSIIPVG